jgi:hypothetical protein
VNKLKTFEEAVYHSPPEGTSPLIILNRIAHQQFVWQANRPNSRACIRNYKIFNTPEIDAICFKRIGMSVQDLYLCGMAFMGSYLSNPATTFPMKIEIPSLTMGKIHKFLTFACRSMDELRPLLAAEQRYDDSFFYAYNPLRAYPLVQIAAREQTFLLCPLPTLLFWRFTGGLYYDLVDDPAFSNAFGRSFQKYVGEAIQRASLGEKIRVIPESSYGTKRRRKDTVDWIATDGESALFIECKAKRLSWGAKIALDDLHPLEADIEYMADAIVQVYKTITDYQAGQYPNFRYELSCRIYPVIVTLEHWHLFGSLMLSILHRLVSAKLEKIGMSLDIVKRMPYAIWHLSELERGMQIVNEIGVRTFMDGKLSDTEMANWEWHSYMSEKFRKSYVNRQLFDDEYCAIFERIGL